MHTRIRPALVGGVAALAINALAVAPVATAAPAPGGIPLRVIRNQLQYCSLICPSVVQGAVEVPVAIAATPIAFSSALLSSASFAQALGAAAASVTAPARAATDPIITNDLDLVLPKAQNALQVSLVEAINVAFAAGGPGELLQAIDGARTHIAGALDQPVGDPVGPTGAVSLLQVVVVEAVNVGSSVLFQATEAGLLDVVEVADDTAQTLARTGNVASAASVAARGTADTLNTAGRTVTDSINTAANHISSSLRNPFPSVKGRPASQPAASGHFAGGPRKVDGVAHRALTAARDAQPAVHDAQPDSPIRHRALTAHTSG